MIKNGYATRAYLKKLELNTKADIKESEQNLKSEMVNLKVEVLGELKKMQLINSRI
jgi:hypothetical protein